MDIELKNRIHNTINKTNVILFMKGDKYLPKCGFSAQVVDILNDLEVDYTSYDILEDEPLRQGLKEYSNWPTYPQLYIRGKLIGGCDVVSKMSKNGELEKLLKNDCQNY